MKLSYKELYRLFKDRRAVDAEWYRREYPDVALANVDPVHHFIQYGARMGRDPSRQFHLRRYAAQFPDVDFSAVNPLAHYLLNFDGKSLPSGMDSDPDYCLAFYGERALERAKSAYDNGHTGVAPIVAGMIASAEEKLDAGPYSIVDKTTLPPSGNRQDYWHPAPYAWPNPETPDGLPYVHRDGERVHGTRLYEAASDKYDRTRVQRLFDETTLHALAWYFTGEERFVAKAHELIRTWFIDLSTRMNPHLEYSQVFMGRNNNRGKPTGLIETKDFYFFLDAVRLVRRSAHWSEADEFGFTQWCEAFLNWLLTSEQGRKECAATNNHGIAYDLQVYAFQAYLGDVPGLRLTLERALERMGEHFDAEGYQAREMQRTTTAHYTAFNLQLWLNFAFLVKNTLNYDLFEHTVDYSGVVANPIALGLKWLLPHYGSEWPYQQIDEFDTTRLPSLYHAAALFPKSGVRGLGERYPNVHQCKAYHFPHDGIAPYWLLNAVSVEDYSALANHRSTVYGKHEIKHQLLKHLWGGLSGPSLIALQGIVNNPRYAVPLRVLAAWELSRWYCFKGDDDTSYRYIQTVLGIDHEQALVKELVLAKAYCEMRFGWMDRAVDTLQEFLGHAEGDPDVLLALATTCSDESQRLEYINQVYRRAGCCHIAKKYPEQPLSMNNLKGVSPEPAASADHKVSVIMPVYNAEDKLTAAVDSLLDQTWHNLEIIIVDDCSSDATYRIAEAYADMDSRVVVRQQPENGGAYKARNSGLKLVTGDFITTHDSDDWSHPQKIEREVNYLLADDSLMGVSANWVRTRQDLSFTQNWRPARTLIHKSESSFLFRRAVYDTLGPWQNVRAGGDNEFIGRMKAQYGNRSYKVIDSHVPYAFGLDDDHSLTRAKATHVSTVYNGLRHVYRELWRWLHQNQSPGHAARPDVIPMPDKMIRRSNDVIEVDWVVMADFCDASMITPLMEAKERGELSGHKIGLFHWPRFDSQPGEFCDGYFQCLTELDAVPLVFGDSVKAQHVAVACRSVVQHEVDARPDVEVTGSVVVLGDVPRSLVKGSVRLFGQPVQYVDRLVF